MSDADRPDEREREERERTDEERPVDDIDIADEEALPEWEDSYFDSLAQRLVFNYDIERDVAVHSEEFDLYGELEMESQKHFFHPALNFANHYSFEHLFVRRVDDARVADLEALVELGHELADDDEWLDAHEDHFNTDFTFALVVPRIRDEVREFVDGFRDRTLLKYGYYGHYEVNLLVVAPDREESVDSQEADVEEAFRTWEEIEREEPSTLDLIRRRLQI